MTIVKNALASRGGAIEPAIAEALGPNAPATVFHWLAACPSYHETPLWDMPALADRFKIARLLIKDESTRFSLGSFKALGGAYAVIRLVADQLECDLGRIISPAELVDPKIRECAATLTVCCATDGNHGRSVAAGAQICGARAVIMVHAGVSEPRIEAMRSFGADVHIVAGDYDDSVAIARDIAQREGWLLVADTAPSITDRVPLLVMQGYTVMVREALDAMDAPPTHILLQAGVGGMAAAVAAFVAQLDLTPRPRIIIVEPDRAACLLASAQAGRPIRIPAGEATVMSMLECFEPSHLAWHVLERTADAFMTISDDQAVAAMRLLAAPDRDDRAIVAGESGGAGIAALIELATKPENVDFLELDRESRVLVINTEGATDPDIYRKLVGA
jgi:diaminopropionate ammonia-lyase